MSRPSRLASFSEMASRFGALPPSADDGTWQSLTSGPFSTEDALLVALQGIVKHDPLLNPPRKSLRLDPNARKTLWHCRAESGKV